jgi:hypothetical protein
VLAGAWWDKRVNKLRGAAGQRPVVQWRRGDRAAANPKSRPSCGTIWVWGLYKMANMGAIGSFAEVCGGLIGGWKTVRPGRHLTERSCRGRRAVVVLGAWQQIVQRSSSDHHASSNLHSDYTRLRLLFPHAIPRVL